MTSQAPLTPPDVTVFDRIRAFGLTRPDRAAGPGVCRGVAARLGVDPLIVRIVVVLISAFFGFGILAYGLAWLLLPERDGRIHAEQLSLGVVTWGAAGSLGLCLLGLSAAGVQLSGEGGLGLGAIGLVAVLLGGLWLSRNSRPRMTGLVDPQSAGLPGPQPPGPGAGTAGRDLRPAALPPPVPQPLAGPSGAESTAVAGEAPSPKRSAQQRVPMAGPRVVAATAGLVLIAIATVVGLFLADIALPGGHFVWGFVIALAISGVATVAAGLTGRRAGGLAPLAVVILAIGLVRLGGLESDQPIWRRYLADEVSTSSPTWRVAGPLGQDRSYDAGLRSRTLDLTDLVPTAGASAHTVNVDASLGSLTVLVPEDLTVELDIEHDWGALEVDGRVHETSPTRIRLGPDDEPELYLTGSADLGLLAIETR